MVNVLKITISALCVFLCMACSDKGPSAEELLNNPQRNVVLRRDSLGAEYWLEVEKNETVQICLDSRVREWKTSLTSKVVNDSCFAFVVPTIIGVDTIKLNFPDSDSSHKINLAVGMKYLDFKNEEVLLGFNQFTERELTFQGLCTTKKGTIPCGPKNEDPERLASVTGTYLVDKYPITNCEIVQVMWDSLTINNSMGNEERKMVAEKWITRKKNSIRNENCVTRDTAANSITLFQAMKYANARSLRENLKPVYIFSKTNEESPRILSKGKYVIKDYDFLKFESEAELLFTTLVSVDETSDGYRLPYYNEWMMLARGGDKKNKTTWGNEYVLKYARFNPKIGFYDSEPVGQLRPNGYGLYDMLGLVEEHVLFENSNPFEWLKNTPSCLKGGDIKHDWRKTTYGSYGCDFYTVSKGGFRLIRNIGNNAKWSENKTVKSNSDRSSPKGKVEIDKSEILVESLPLKLGTDSKPNVDSAVVRKDNVLLAGFVPVTSSNIVYGNLQENGIVAPENPAIPLINAIPNDWIRSYFANSNFARVAKVYVKKSPKTRKKSLKVRLNLWKEDKTPYDFKPVNLVLYRNGEEKGYYIYQTMTNSKGKPLLFTKNEDDAGNYEDAIILCIKDSTDRFYYELLK